MTLAKVSQTSTHIQRAEDTDLHSDAPSGPRGVIWNCASILLKIGRNALRTIGHFFAKIRQILDRLIPSAHPISKWKSCPRATSRFIGCAVKQFKILVSSFAQKSPQTTGQKADWTNLPKDIYPLIFRDRLAIRSAIRVCKCWHRNVLAPLKQLRVHRLPDTLPEMCQSLERLTFTRTAKIAPQDFKVLTRFQNLRVLELDYQTTLDDTSLRSVSGLVGLKMLSLAYCDSVTDLGLRYLSEPPLVRTLETINLDHCTKITDLGICALGKGRVTRIMLHRCKKVLGWGFKDFSKKDRPALIELRVIDQSAAPEISNGLIPNRFARALTTFVDTLPLLNDLYILDLSKCTLNDTLFSGLCSNLRKLSDLFLTNCQGLSWNVLFALSELKSLRRLSLARLSMLDHTAPALTHLTRLQWLNLSNCTYLTSASAVPLSQIKSLKKVLLNGCNAQLHLEVWTKRPTVEFEANYLFHNRDALAVEALEKNRTTLWQARAIKAKCFTSALPSMVH